MIIDEQRMLDHLEPLIKIIKQRQSMFFQVLGFASKNIQSSSNQIDQVTIFTKFLATISQNQNTFARNELQLLKILGPNEQLEMEGFRISNTSKQMMRLTARIIQIIQSSIEKTRSSLFNQNGKLSIDFARFKKNLHKIIQQNPIQLLQYAKTVINFGKNKFKRQITKIKNYLQKLKDGQHISFREMFGKDRSDASVSADEKYHPERNLVIKQIETKFLKDHKQISQSQSPSPGTKRPSLKKSNGGSKGKRAINLKSSKKQQCSQKNYEKQMKLQKSATAAQLLRFYTMMELCKKDFLEDYVFQKQQQEKQRKRIMNQLLQRNRLNQQQIRQYSQKCLAFNPSVHLIANPSSDENKTVQRNDSSVNSKASIKTSFVISKRKQSFTFQSASDKSDGQFLKHQIPFSRTIKNLTTKKRSPQQKSARQANQSKKIFVVKSPLTFDDDVIPKAQITQAGWVQAPLTGKQRGNRKNQSLRLKKRNNPCPLDQKFLPESFRFSQHPL